MSQKRGFTLIELLVVISIIAILSVIGMTAYGVVQKNARDAKRKTDIDAIASAMEVNYGKTTGGQYNALAGPMFSSSTVPNDPINTTSGTGTACPTACQYCFNEGSSAVTLTSCAGNSTKLIKDSSPTGPLGGTNAYWIICANQEAGNSYCRANSQ